MFALHEPDLQNAFCFAECAPTAGFDPQRRWGNSATPGCGVNSPAMMRARADAVIAEVCATPKPKRRPMHLDVEQALIKSKRAYIAVDEAKKALFAGAKLKSFHFVVYFPEGKNWLVCAKRGFSAEDQKAMLEWEKIFGEGFIAVRAFAPRTDLFNDFIFRKLDGEQVSL